MGNIRITCLSVYDFTIVQKPFWKEAMKKEITPEMSKQAESETESLLARLERTKAILSSSHNTKSDSQEVLSVMIKSTGTFEQN